ncbi:glycosyltransferase involved in cell wall biosynthesis [Flavobacterium sp. HSC-32F16]|uniref:glycosyltransferase family A protein n=1 Tax=Flavobacterium sp. HSC-32F16 TaxID=2910964 RepID=UPI0020A5A289|nr:glycosyltransferase family A protein [Flavobacterium sp. HSC-32F16]MCP2027238.1 glycosyltransferase involved in cell wall biosynthesis [Flavobacterium sp. HSC-32F16]
MSNVFSENDFEILIATKNRSNLDFLQPMFPFEHFSTFNLLIVNQTENTNLNSDYDSVRVLNTNEKGLSKSRNKAIQNASKSICLFTDDDVIFEENLRMKILSSFEKDLESSIITFNHSRIGDLEPQKKTIQTFSHNQKSIWNVSSIEIAFKLNDIKKSNISFDENFGLGSFFETAEEFLFLKSALSQNLKVSFDPQIIVSHPQFSSGKNEGSDSIIYARSALFYKLYHNFAYVWLIKYVFFLVRRKSIKISEIPKKSKAGINGISKFKELTKSKL